MSNKLNIITNAIENKKVIHFYYDGYLRCVQPHHYGILNGKQQLHAYQIEGLSKKEQPIGWKNFEIAKIENLLLGDLHFHPRRDHNPSNSNYSVIKKSVL